MIRVRRPKCRYCGRRWLPDDDLVASRAYCSFCRLARRLRASELVGSEMPAPSESRGYVYELPRRSRPRRLL